ncbi:DUF3899 domain-containing protein [Pontibacillus salicampi]|uniref:DUF3899 domain-containing protein n=1 Tax=Pontibacillus salicampi TaxID=1449801 RepID=A0ABV6LRA8_9BACI
MVILQNKWWFLLINVVFSIVFFLLIAPIYNLYHFINSVFYVSYFYLMAALLLFVIKGKFFDAFTYSLRRFQNRMMKDQDLMDEWKTKKLPSEWVRPSVLKALFFQGAVLSFGMIVLLAYFYML